jgi:hypothetical protein
MISLLAVLLTSIVGLGVYQKFTTTSDHYIPVAELMESNKQASQKVKDLMARILYLHPEVSSVWLYSWPDAANLDLVHQVGDHKNPLPTGHLWQSDAPDIGKLTLNICTELNRKLKNTACSIVSQGDSWGLLVVVWDETRPRPDGYESFVAAMAARIAHLLYSH